MSFLARIAQQARSATSPDRAVARPKGLLPEMPALALPVDRPAIGEHPNSQTEASVTTPEAAPPAAFEPSDEPLPVGPRQQPDIAQTPDQSTLDQRLPTVAGPTGARPDTVDETDVERPDPPVVVDTETGGVSNGRDRALAIAAEAADGPPIASTADAQRGGDVPPAAPSAAEPVPASPSAAPREDRRRPAAPTIAEHDVEQPDREAPKQGPAEAASQTQQGTPPADGDGGAPTVQPAPVHPGADRADAYEPKPPPIFEPSLAPQGERTRPAPPIQPPTPEKAPLLQIDQIDVVVTDPAPAQPAAPARSRLAAMSASRRYLRRL